MSIDDEEMDDIWNNRQHLYLIPEKILFNSDLTINDLRVFSVFHSFIHSMDSSTQQVFNFLKEKVNLKEETARECLKNLIEKGCLAENEGYITLSYLYLWQ